MVSVQTEVNRGYRLFQFMEKAY